MFQNFGTYFIEQEKLPRQKHSKEKSTTKETHRPKKSVKSVITVPDPKRKRKTDKTDDSLSMNKKSKQTTPKSKSTDKKDVRRVVESKTTISTKKSPNERKAEKSTISKNNNAQPVGIKKVSEKQSTTKSLKELDEQTEEELLEYEDDIEVEVNDGDISEENNSSTDSGSASSRSTLSSEEERATLNTNNSKPVPKILKDNPELMEWMNSMVEQRVEQAKLVKKNNEMTAEKSKSEQLIRGKDNVNHSEISIE